MVKISKNYYVRKHVRTALRDAVMAQVELDNKLRDVELELGFEVSGMDEWVGGAAVNFCLPEQVEISKADLVAFEKQVDYDD